MSWVFLRPLSTFKFMVFLLFFLYFLSFCRLPSTSGIPTSKFWLGDRSTATRSERKPASHPWRSFSNSGEDIPVKKPISLSWGSFLNPCSSTWKNSESVRKDHIPHIIHQSWKNATIPAKFHAWANSWLEKHPTWEYKLWTDMDNRQLIKV